MIPHLRHTQPVVIHLQHCDCADCMPAASSDRRGLSWTEAAAWGLGGCLFANALVFALDPHGAWAALSAAAAHLLGGVR